MLETVFGAVVEVTLTSSVVILLLLTLSKVLDQNLTANWRYWVWLLITIRLVLPFNMTLSNPPVQLPTTEIVNQLTAMTFGHQSTLQEAASESLTELDGQRLLNTTSLTDSPSAGNFQLADIFWILWIGGASVFMLWQLTSYAIFFRRIKANSKDVSQPDFLSDYRELCHEMKINRQIPLKTSPLITSPLVLGICKQQLFLPEMVFKPQHLRMILRHELIHVQRRDILYKILILLVRALHWFNPLVHLMAIEANKAVEASCDAAIVANQDIDFRKDYSQAIFLIVQNCRPSQVVFSSHFSGGKKIIMKRLENLFDMRIKKKGVVPFIVIILIISMIGLCVSCRPSTTLTSQNPATTTTIATQSAAAADPKLIGKWIEEVPADIGGLPLDSIELFANGKAIIAGQYDATYSIIDEKLQCTVGTDVYTGKYDIVGTKLTIFKDSGESKVYVKAEPVISSDPKLIGKWVEEDPAEIFGLPRDSIEFFTDGKAIIADQYDATYAIIDGKLQCTVDADVYTGKYDIVGTKLTIYKDTGEFKIYLKNES